MKVKTFPLKFSTEELMVIGAIAEAKCISKEKFIHEAINKAIDEFEKQMIESMER